MTAEQVVQNSVQWLRLAVEATGALIVGLGFLVAGLRFLRLLVTGKSASFTAVRLVLARYLALALEFQLGADILSTAVAPTWDQIGKLAAIAVIRTTLNYFLSIEMRGERATAEGEADAEAAVTASSAGTPRRSGP